MKLYTFQPLFVWQTLQELGYYHPFSLYEHDSFLKDECNDNHWGFSCAYDWLKEQMHKRNVQSIANSSHMVWAWYQWGGKNKHAPDKRYANVYNYFPDQEYVMLELDISDSRVLLSDYDAWHSVLNYWPLTPQRESNRLDKELNYFKNKPNSIKDIHPVISKSWENIFDFTQCRKILQYPQKRQYIQATFFDISYTDIKAVHLFKNKRCQQVINLNN